MTDTNDPLKDLIQEDAGAIDRDLLKNTLKPYVAFSASGDVTVLKQFYGKSNQQKVLIMLLAQKAKSLIFPDTEESLSPSVLINAQIMAEGSVKTTLKYLLEKVHEIKKDSSNKYYIPTYLLAEMPARLEESA